MNNFPGTFGAGDDLGRARPLRSPPEDSGPLAASSAIDLHEIWAAVYRSRYLITAVLIACMGAGLLGSLLLTQRYRAESTVQIDQEAAKVLGTEQMDPSAAQQDSERFLRTQIDIIQSRTMANAVATSLKLYTNDAFLTAMGQEPTEALPNLSERDSRREQVLELLRDNLTIVLPPDSRVVRLAFNSRDPVQAARIANSFATNYISANLQRKFDNTAYARSFLGDQLQAAQARLGRAERDAVDYARRARIVDTSNAAGSAGVDRTGGSITSATLVQLNSQLSDAIARRVEAEGLWSRASQVSPLTLTEVLTNSAVQQLIQQRATLLAQYQDELKRRKADFPTVAQLKARIDELDSEIRIVAANIRSSIKVRYDTARQQEQELLGNVNRLKNANFDEQNQSVQLSILRRAADTYRTQYDYLLKRFNELSSEAGVQANNVSLVDRAPIPTAAVFPNVPLNIMLALIVGVVLSGALVFLRARLFEAVRTPRDVTERLGMSLLGITPAMADGDEVRRELVDAKTPMSEAFSSVRTALSFAGPDGLPKVLAFTSTRQAEGKSTACYATALSLGRSGRTVVVVDLDLRRPSQHYFADRERGIGVSDLLVGQARLDDVIVPSAHTNVSLVYGGASLPPNPTELLDNSKLDELIAELSRRFDCVLLDGPPVLGLADALIIGARADFVVVVVEAGRNHARGVAEALSRLRGAHVRILGAILSRFDAGKAGYGHDYSYTYQYRYES